MGNIFGKEKESIKKLTDYINRYDDFANENVCKNFEIFYKNKLATFTIDEVKDVALSIGLKYTGDIPRDKLCRDIFENYSLRIKIVKLIRDTIVSVKQKIDKAQYGQVCRDTNKIITDFNECQSNKGLWLDELEYQNLLNKISSSGNLNIWSKNFDKLKDTYDKLSRKLFKIFDAINKDIDSKFNMEQLNKLLFNTQEISNNMNQICDVLYLAVINTRVN